MTDDSNTPDSTDSTDNTPTHPDCLDDINGSSLDEYADLNKLVGSLTERIGTPDSDAYRMAQRHFHDVVDDPQNDLLAVIALEEGGDITGGIKQRETGTPHRQSVHETLLTHVSAGYLALLIGVEKTNQQLISEGKTATRMEGITLSEAIGAMVALHDGDPATLADAPAIMRELIDEQSLPDDQTNLGDYR